MTPIPATHADHDLLAVAAFAAGDAEGVELDAALAAVAACPACAALHHDLRAIARAMPALPAPVRTRDFRLTPEQAASLRPAGWRRFLTPLAGPRFAFAGPLGTGLATLGVAGFLLAGSLGMPLAGTAAAPQQNLEATPDTAALVAPSADPAAAGATPDADGPMMVAPGAESPESPETPEIARASDDPAGGGGEFTGANAASPGVDGGIPGTDPGTEGPMGSNPTGPKATDGRDSGASPVPESSLTRLSSADAPGDTVPVTTPLLALASLMLVAGVLLGGLRLVARRAA
jgi:hypothetical protein